MNKKIGMMKKIFVVIILFCNLSGWAQQDALFSQYMFNKLLVNPGYAGSTETFSVDVLDRYQWVGIDGAPRTMTLSGHTLLGNKVGLGAYVYRDELGPTVDQGIMASYSYRIMTRHGWFSFGIQGGIKYFDFDWDAINTEYPDNTFDPEDVRQITPDLNLGLYYYTPRFFAGLSSKQLLENEYGSTSTSSGSYSFSRLSRHFYLMTGMAFPLNDKMVFRPSLMGKYVGNAPVQFDFNASILFNDMFWIGAAYRTEKAVVFLTEFKIANGIRLGYSFDLYMNELQVHNSGSHEFRLGFDVQTKKDRMKTPRYF
jgi:type IX secretion system PorP/SprF family membrane protein